MSTNSRREKLENMAAWGERGLELQAAADARVLGKLKSNRNVKM
jgi:hypothetical protein